MRHLTQSIRITGYVENIKQSSFDIRTRSGDVVQAFVNDNTNFFLVRNTDKLDRDRSPGAPDALQRYLVPQKLVSAYGIQQEHGDSSRYDVRAVALFGDDKDHYVFEESHWWLTQISSFADTWLERQFGLGDQYDFTGYRTNLDASGRKVDGNSVQECDTISRLIYGLSSAYLLTGNARYLQAARNGVRYQRDMFRTISDDGAFVVWHHAINNGRKILASQFDDDRDSIPLYEQIYALAGLAQFYRITSDWEVLEDIRRTMTFFELYFRDREKGGFFSHIDPVTQSWDSDRLDMRSNRARKNWNSVGDHTPAYLLNVILAIEGMSEHHEEHTRLLELQKELADLICDRFKDPESVYVNERFDRNWKPDHSWRWQQNRAVVGHNLKIAWNLTRAYHLLGQKRYLDYAVEIADKMPQAGMDMIRGGWFDVVERRPQNGMPLEFPWHNRKAWWQQEQAILAYLILAGSVEDRERKREYLALARESIAFWNLAFLDHDYGETYFDVLDNGYPFLVEDRAQSASHSKSGYHSMELNYLAHVYYRLLVAKDRPLSLHFCLSADRTVDKLNVLPDCVPRDKVRIASVLVEGEPHKNIDYEKFQVILPENLRNREVEVNVRLAAVK